MAQLAAGTRLGPYEIASVIGAGSMGEVYRARDTRLQRDVAIKVLPATYSSDPERLARFEREARTTGQLAHPNILAIYDAGTYEGRPYIVSELLEGETLRQRLRGRALPSRKAAEIALQIAQGLAAVKETGLVHRDLKPENVFITADGRVKILDFGLAKLVEPKPARRWAVEVPPSVHTQEGFIVGTAGYMSPEQVEGKPLDHRSDIFAFGSILYEMLSGERAFWRENAVESLHAILSDEPPDLLQVNPACPFSLARIARHCLEKDPHDRFQSARDLALALEDALVTLSSLSVPSQVLSGGVRGLRRRLRHARLIVTVAALVAASVGVGVVLTRIGRPSPPPRFEQLTFRRGTIRSARFTPDGQTVVFGAAWEGTPFAVFSTRVGVPEARGLGLAGADILSISRGGVMAVSLRRRYRGVWVQTGTLAQAPLAGGEPREMLEGVEWADWSPDGRDVAVVRFVNGQDRLEYPIGTVLASTAGWIGHPRVSPDGREVAFFDHPVWTDDGGSLVVVDRRGNRRTLAADLTSAQGLSWSPGGDEVWFASSDTGIDRALWAVSRAGRRRPVLMVPATLTLHDLAADGRVLFARESWRIGILAVAPGEDKPRDLSWLDYSLVRDLSADGRTLLFTEGGRGGGARYGAYVRRTDGSPAVRLADGYALALSADGSWAITSPNVSPRQLVL